MVKTRAFTAMDPSLIPGGGTKIPQAVRCSQKEKRKKNGWVLLKREEGPFQSKKGHIVGHHVQHMCAP